MQYFGASVDSVDANRKFAASLGAPYPILSDPTKEVARAYGVLAPSGFASRWTFYIGADGRIMLTMPYVEMGQGTYTAIPMLIAEELEVDLEQVKLEHAPPNEKLYANPLLGIQATGNSNAIRGAWQPPGSRRRHRPAPTHQRRRTMKAHQMIEAQHEVEPREVGVSDTAPTARRLVFGVIVS